MVSILEGIYIDRLNALEENATDGVAENGDAKLEGDGHASSPEAPRQPHQK